LSRKLEFLYFWLTLCEFEVIEIVTKYLWIKKYTFGPLVCYFACCVT